MIKSSMQIVSPEHIILSQPKKQKKKQKKNKKKTIGQTKIIKLSISC